jgi:hypothetical protein
MIKEQIEELTNELIRTNSYGTLNAVAEHLYNAGYRKQSEGHWFILEYEYFTCSECGYYCPNGCDSTKEAKEKLADGEVPKYCSECGAKMKGGAK